MCADARRSARLRWGSRCADGARSCPYPRVRMCARRTQRHFLRLAASSCLAAIFLAGCQAPPPADDAAGAEAAVQPSLRLPDVSGMARCDDGKYVVVHDARTPSEPRAGIVTISGTTAPTFESIAIRDEALPGGQLADIEALAALPRRPREFLALESGSAAEGRAPRRLLVHLRLVPTASGGMELRVAGAVDVLDATAALENCEGLACWAHNGEIRVLLADRGRVRPRHEPAEVAMVAGTVVLGGVEAIDAQPARDAAGATESLRFIPRPSAGGLSLRVPLKAAGTWRLCSDLHLDPEGALWGACAQDLGAAGPFRSRIYRAGDIDPAGGWPRLRAAVFEHDVDGLKVEALAACDLLRASLCFATDDEFYGGVWRPLRASSQGETR